MGVIFHWTAIVVWTALAIICIVSPLKYSVAFVSFASIYANIISHGAALEALQAKKEARSNGDGTETV